MFCDSLSESRTYFRGTPLCRYFTPDVIIKPEKKEKERKKSNEDDEADDDDDDEDDSDSYDSEDDSSDARSATRADSFLISATQRFTCFPVDFVSVFSFKLHFLYNQITASAKCAKNC